MPKGASWAKLKWFMLCWALARRKDHLWEWGISWGAGKQEVSVHPQLGPWGLRLTAPGDQSDVAGLPLAPADLTADLSLILNPARALLGLLLAHYPCSWIPLLLTREPFPMLLARSSVAAVSLPSSLSFPDQAPAGNPSCLSLSRTSSGSPSQGLSQYGIINASVCCLLPS